MSRLRCGGWTPTRRRAPPSSSCARATGSVLGRLPAIEVRTPWWQDIEPVVEAAREAFGIEVVVLRMLDSELPRPHGGRVTYLAETAARLPAAAADALEPWSGTLDEQPLRLSWAVPGGPDADVAWAEDVLRRRGIERRGPGRAGALVEPVVDLAPAARRRGTGVAQGRPAVLRPRGRRPAAAPGGPGAAAARPRRAADPPGRHRGRGPVRRAAAGARADGRPARRAPGGMVRPRGGAARDAAARTGAVRR